jgi:hypothetical protein
MRISILRCPGTSHDTEGHKAAVIRVMIFHFIERDILSLQIEDYLSLCPSTQQSEFSARPR